MGKVVQLNMHGKVKSKQESGAIKAGNADLISRHSVCEELLVLKAVYEDVERRDPDLAGMIAEIFCDSKACAHFTIKTTAESPGNLGLLAHIADICVHEWVGGHNGIVVKGPKAEVTVDTSWPIDDEQ